MTNPLDPDKNYQIHNEEIEGLLKNIGTSIGGQIPKGWVFNLVIASVGEKGSTFYISNMERDNSMDVLQELINKNRPASERYPEIKQAVRLLTDCASFLAASNTLREDPTELVTRIKDYVENV